ncbi:MAG TPA: hypothetical protein VFF06_00045 [Polyangia bacterium]|nr:hypothetical protein [Polyangia bacterium]
MSDPLTGDTSANETSYRESSFNVQYDDCRDETITSGLSAAMAACQQMGGFTESTPCKSSNVVGRCQVNLSQSGFNGTETITYYQDWGNVQSSPMSDCAAQSGTWGS